MRQLILLLVMLVSTCMVEAQVGKGLLVSGALQLGFGSSSVDLGGTKVDGPSTLNLLIQPRVGYFFTDRIGVGVEIQYGMNRTKDDSGSETEITVANTIGFGVVGRYALPLNDKAGILYDLGVGYNTQRGKTEIGSNSTDTDPINTIQAGLGIGMIYFPSAKIGLESSLGGLLNFAHVQQVDANDSDNKVTASQFNVFDLNAISFNIGMGYYFNRGDGEE